MEWYARAEDYDLWFSWDPGPEADFVLGASDRWGIVKPQRIFEPMCGSGRLLRAMPGRAVGLDRQPGMAGIAGRTHRAVVGDAGHLPFRDGAFDLAYNLIDSFRHLRSEDAAAHHLREVARVLLPGAVYVLGLDIGGDLPADVSRDEWAGERGGESVRGFVESLGDADPGSRLETLRIVYERGGATREFCEAMRTYTRRQFEDLIDREGSFEIAAIADQRLDLDRTFELSEIAGSAVVVLRR